ncbi:hypothetical protein U1769_25390, partial [Sphingomonas sp. ZT3P38]|uniref:hypothetical protein n=1 Tax=Parasphingomonas zepuensis TaxID=3096161 RepID=UPI002FC5CC11
RHASPDCPVANGGSGTGTAISEVVGLVAASLANGSEVSFNGISRPGDPAHTRADISEALGWGWTPEKRLDAGVSEYVAWFREPGS